MESLIPMMAKLQTIFETSGIKSEIPLPRIAVIGSQSSGKSSVLESIVGRDFLPRGDGTVTRCPLMLHLHRIEKAATTPSKIQHLNVSNQDASWFEKFKWYLPFRAPFVTSPVPVQQGTDEDNVSESEPLDTRDYAKFQHKSDVKFDDFEKVREEIENQTKFLVGDTNDISETPIILDIYSSKVVNLSLIDLPGYIENDPPGSIGLSKRIIKMVREYIDEENTIILAVSQANNDLANSKAISNAAISDKDGLRTINVLTHLDIMNEGTDANIMLTKPENKNIGNIGVVNRSQADIKSKKSMEYCLIKEKEFFEKKYPKIAAEHGIKYLSERLSDIFKKHINKKLPALKKKMQDMEQNVNLELQSLGTPIGGVEDKQQKARYAIDRFTAAYLSVIDGSSKTLEKSTIIGGALIADTFHIQFCKNMKELKPLGNLSTKEIITSAKNASGLPYLDLQKGFEVIVKERIKSMHELCEQCVDDVYIKLENIIKDCNVGNGSNQFPYLYTSIRDTASTYLNSRLTPTKECVRNLVEMQCAYINRKHPHFINPPKADPQSEQLANSDNEIASSGEEISDSDKRDVKEIKRLVEVYFQIVVQTMQDMVPKAIMMFLVNYFGEKLRGHLYDELSKDLSIVFENSEVSKKRAELKMKLEGLNLSFDLFKDLEKFQS